MKKYPKIVQCDKRGQIVIPKDIRNELKVEEGTGFWMYSITDEGILLKKIDKPQLDDHQEIIEEMQDKADKVEMRKENIDQSVENYKRTKEGNLDII